MAFHKVPQDVEAEDKLLGPLSFKQFIYAIVDAILIAAVIFGFRLNPIIGILFLPPTLLFAILAFYRRPDQSVESYLVALFGYWFKPRVRHWDSDGIAEHVKIMAPKKVEDHFSDGRNRAQVKSQLNQLAQIVDTRGWSTKGVSAPDKDNDVDDRLVTLEEIDYASAKENPRASVEFNEDIMDENSSELARTMSEKTEQTANQARKKAIQNMQQAAKADTPS